MRPGKVMIDPRVKIELAGLHCDLKKFENALSESKHRVEKPPPSRCLPCPWWDPCACVRAGSAASPPSLVGDWKLKQQELETHVSRLPKDLGRMKTQESY